MALLPCPSCHGDHKLDVYGRCERCRGEWIAPAHTEATVLRHGFSSPAGSDAAASHRLPFLRKHISRGPPTERNCPADRAALKAFDIPGTLYEGDLFYGKETPRSDTHSIGEGCSQCGGVWMEADQLARGGERKAVAENLARLAESLA